LRKEIEGLALHTCRIIKIGHLPGNRNSGRPRKRATTVSSLIESHLLHIITRHQLPHLTLFHKRTSTKYAVGLYNGKRIRPLSTVSIPLSTSLFPPKPANTQIFSNLSPYTRKSSSGIKLIFFRLFYGVHRGAKMALPVEMTIHLMDI
jgi:hypothetical protein